MRQECLSSKQLKRYGLFHCDFCGTDIEKPLVSGLKYNSCGCQQARNLPPAGERNPNYRHGRCGKLIYGVWGSMRSRCSPTTTPANLTTYYNRGIRVCEEWETAANFIEWAYQAGYRPGLMLDRINNDLGYFPANCRFVDLKTSANNKRCVDRIKALFPDIQLALDMKMPIEEISRTFKVSDVTIRKYIKTGDLKGIVQPIPKHLRKNESPPPTTQ